MSKKLCPKLSLSNYQNAHQGQRAFIIGNGPSLNKLDLTKLRDEVTFGVNSIYLLFEKIGFKPTYYVVEDTLVAEDRAQDINQLSGMTKIFGNYLDYCLTDGPEVIRSNVIFEYSDYPGFPHFSRRADQCLWVGGTVSYLCMQLAYFMGFSEVYLIGFDHSYDIPQDAKINGTIITSRSDDPNHFHPDYFGKGKRWHDPRLDRMELAYSKAKQVFEHSGRKIINATAGGKLEIFPRINFEDIFSREKPGLTGTSPIQPEAIQQNPDEIGISVVVCTYQNPLSLVNTLESLLDQSLAPDKYEVIVVDNHSQDQTQAVTASFPEFRYILEKKVGLSHARNTGIQEARGEIIAFIDDDAEADREWLQSLLTTHKTNSDAWAVGGKVEPIWDAPRPDWLTEHFHRSLSLIDWGEKLRPLQWPERIIGTNCSFRKEAFQKVGQFDTKLGRMGKLMLGNEDTEIQQRIHQLGHQVLYQPDAVVHHHIPASRMTKEYFQKRDQGHQYSQHILSLRQQHQDESEINRVIDKLRKKSLYDEQKEKWQTARENSQKSLKRFENKHAGERCVIIGNGPSLNKMDLSLLKDEITFGLNRIYLGFDGWDFRPDYFVSVNSLVLEQHAEEIMEHIQAPKFISYHGLPYFPTDRDDVIFLQSLDEPIFTRQPSQGVWEGYTVTYVAMQLAYYMGFSEVILIGVDHSFVDQGPANAEVVSQGEDQNHFAKDYFGKGARWHLPDLHNSEMAYRLANFVYRSDNRQILDATVNGKLTVFPKVNYQEHLGHQDLPGSEMRKTDPEYLISAIVSTYNDADLLPGCLDDLEKQTIADQLEIIVVDSGSEENEAEIVREYQQRYENIVYLRTERESLYDAWNRGIFLARGKYITNANTDDGHRTDALELLVKALEENPGADLAYSHCSWTSQPNDSFEDSHGYRDVYYPTYNPEKAMFYCLLGPHPVWRKDVFEKIGMFDNRFRAAGDFDFQFRFVAAGLEAVLVPEILSLFYQNPGGLTLEDGTSNQEAGKIYQKYRAGIPVSSLYRINPKSRDDTAAAWTALGNRAVRFTPPWEDLPQQDLSYASYCYQRALQSQPRFYPAFHNLITILGGMGKWEQAREVLQEGAFYEANELEKAVQQQQLLPLETVKVPIKSSLLEYHPAADTSPAQQKQIHSKPIKAPFGFNVIGYLSGRIGLGVTARNVLQALQERGYPVQGFDLELKDGRGGADLSTLDIPIIKNPAKLHYGVNLYVAPPPTLEWLHEEITHYQRGEPRLKVAWSMWELPVIPEEWVPALEAMDLLIAESDFIRYAFDFNLSGVRSITAPHPLFLPEGILADREHFNLPELGVLFLTGFEPLSDPRRKNPGGAVSAFLNALGEEKNAHLIIKLNHGTQDGQPHPLVQPLVDQCAAHPRIHILNQSFTYQEVLSLYKSCDVIVSLHRSEGLGLVPMEAMRLEKPVLATAWSGNMSYMNYTNSCPVSYRLIQADGSLPQYRQKTLGPNAVWADPNLDDAAKWMRRLFVDSEMRKNIGSQGKQDLENYQQRATQALFLNEIEALWEHRASDVNYPIQTSSSDHERDPKSDIKSKEAKKIFQEILEADDLQDALEKNYDRLNHAVLDLVEESILDARSNGQNELAQGLENLAAYISEAIA